MHPASPGPQGGAGGAVVTSHGGGAQVIDPNRHVAPAPAGGHDNTAVLTTSAPATQPTLTREEAKAALDEGAGLLRDGKVVAARASLSKAFFSGQLTPQEEDQAVKALTLLADRTIFSRELIEGDPYNAFYAVKPRDTLEGRSGIEMSQGLHVPAALLMKVNGMTNAASLRQGQTLKLIKGPFHAIVRKGRFLMDLYLQREGLEKVFVRRITVGLGKNGSTPIGAWRVKQGQKMFQPLYNATTGSGMREGTGVLWNQPGYPFGTKALWIGLEGMDPHTSLITDFGIHSTNDPASIGKANSLGCVRMADQDIDLVFSLLYDVHSKVDVVP
jgi:lipoprotein-anchoring transpeptidase ErfK/SrfK